MSELITRVESAIADEEKGAKEYDEMQSMMQRALPNSLEEEVINTLRKDELKHQALLIRVRENLIKKMERVV
jgi:hypothetical protein